MGAHRLEIRRSSASLWGEKTGMRHLPVVSKYIDTSTCIGCKACEVACQEWNDLRVVPTEQTGTYQTLPTLDAEFWNLIQFRERETENETLAWLMRKDQCMHCEDPGCLAACPAPGAIVQYENGIVDVDPSRCIGCGYCLTGCPFNVPRFHKKTGKMAKCTLCVDRVQVGLEPACVKACPTVLPAVRHQGRHGGAGPDAGGAAQGGRLREGGALRPAGRRRHGGGDGARPRRPSRSGTTCLATPTSRWRCGSGRACSGPSARSRSSGRSSRPSGTS